MELKKPLSFSNQVKSLIQHGIIVSDESKAKKVLSEVNYYRLSGYALQYRIEPHRSDCMPGITFEHLCALYSFDVLLRSLLRKYLEELELLYRTKISYYFSMNKCQKAPHSQHYNVENYYRKDKFEQVIKNFNREREYFSDSLIVSHHARWYDNKMPLWVMVELMSFTNLSKYFSCMYYSNQKDIAQRQKFSVKELTNHLHAFSVLRNKCAHGARLYNTKISPPISLKTGFLRKYPNVFNDTLFAYFIVLVQHLSKCQSKLEFISELVQLCDRFSKDIKLNHIGLTEDYERILKESASI